MEKELVIIRPAQVRAIFMTWLYEATRGQRARGVPIRDFRQSADAAALDARDIEDALVYLAQKGLVELHDPRINGFARVTITAYGVDEVERAKERPDAPSEHFAPLQQVHFHAPVTVTGSQVQIATVDSYQRGNFDVKVGDIRRFIGAARQLAEDPAFDEATRATILHDADVMEREIGLERPRAEVLALHGRSIRAIVEGMLGSLAASAVVENWRHLVDLIRSIPWG